MSNGTSDYSGLLAHRILSSAIGRLLVGLLFLVGACSTNTIDTPEQAKFAVFLAVSFVLFLSAMIPDKTMKRKR
jgi:hypothetical protein